jgi:hypothetical protein
MRACSTGFWDAEKQHSDCYYTEDTEGSKNKVWIHSKSAVAAAKLLYSVFDLATIIYLDPDEEDWDQGR